VGGASYRGNLADALRPARTARIHGTVRVREEPLVSREHRDLDRVRGKRQDRLACTVFSTRIGLRLPCDRAVGGTTPGVATRTGVSRLRQTRFAVGSGTSAASGGPLDNALLVAGHALERAQHAHGCCRWSSPALGKVTVATARVKRQLQASGFRPGNANSKCNGLGPGAAPRRLTLNLHFELFNLQFPSYASRDCQRYQLATDR